MLLLYLCLIILLLHITYQDYKTRKIYWIGIPIILFIYALLVGYYSIYTPSFQEIILNTLIISLQLASVWLYFKVFKPNEDGFIDKKLGLGDVLLLYCIVFIFSPVALIIFELLVCILSLFISFVTYVLKSLSSPLTIPFAGNLSFVVAMIFIAELSSKLILRNLSLFELMQIIYN